MRLSAEGQAALANHAGWMSVNAARELADERGYWIRDADDEAIEIRDKHNSLRRFFQERDDSGQRRFASIERTSDGASRERVYMQEPLFDREAYRQTVTYHSGVARHHWGEARAYQRRAKERYDFDIPLPPIDTPLEGFES